MTNNYYKKQRKASKKSTWKLPKSFWREKDKKCQYARERYRNPSEEEKEKKRQYHRERNKNLSEEQKQEKVEYMRNYYLANKK